MPKNTKILMFGGITLALLLSITASAFPAQTAMKDVFGVDFGEDFAVSIDLNVESSTFPSSTSLLDNAEVIKDHVNGASNPEVRTSDSNEWYDQDFFLAHYNTSDINNIYMAVEKLENNLTIKAPGGLTYNLGHVNGSVPFQTLLQYYQNDGKDVMVANTFRGYVAYTTTAEDQLLDKDDQTYLGYTLVEENLLNYLNTVLDDNGFGAIPQYGYEPIYRTETNGDKVFGMKYTNFFTVWQDTEAEPPEALKSIANLLDGFEGVATGGNIVAASLFDYLSFTYTVKTRLANETHTIVDVETKYDVGPMKWLITTDDLTTYELLNSSLIPGIDHTNSFHTEEYPISFQTGYSVAPWFNVTVPALSFYTGGAVPVRSDADAIAGANAEGYGIAVATSTNVYKAGLTVDLPSTPQNDMIPLSVGGDTFFETSFVGKATYDRTLTNGTVETGLPVYINMTTLENAMNLVKLTPDLLQGYFETQSKMTNGAVLFAAKALSPVYAAATSSSVLDMTVEDTAYVTFVQMPKWSGMEVVQDPTYSAVAAVAGADETSDTPGDTETGDTETTSGGGGGGSTTAIPGYELLTMLAVIPVGFYLKRRR